MPILVISIGDVCDNCPFVPNPDRQEDGNNNGIGDACEQDHTNAPISTAILTETYHSESSLVETLAEERGVINDVSADGDLSGTFSFSDFEIVSIKTGPFADKGFYKSAWQANLEGTGYTGEWSGMYFLKPNERRMY